MIEDDELRAIFSAECEEHLEHLDAALLHLEQNPEDQPVLEDAFREAHSLKGSSRMLEVETVKQVAHRFEDMLGEARRGEASLTSEVIDRLYRQLDAIRLLVREAVTGESSGIDVSAVLAALDTEQEGGVGRMGSARPRIRVHSQERRTRQRIGHNSGITGLNRMYRLLQRRIRRRPTGIQSRKGAPRIRPAGKRLFKVGSNPNRPRPPRNFPSREQSARWSRSELRPSASSLGNWTI